MNPTFANALKDKFKKVEIEIQNGLEIQMVSDLKKIKALVPMHNVVPHKMVSPDALFCEVMPPKTVFCKLKIELSKTGLFVHCTIELSTVMLPDVDMPLKMIVLPEHPRLCEVYHDSADMSDADSNDSMYELYCDTDA
jgi:hypothetical protein